MILTVRDGGSATAFQASRVLETFLIESGHEWAWDVPRWFDGKLTRMSIVLPDIDTAFAVSRLWHDHLVGQFKKGCRDENSEGLLLVAHDQF
jgi:hypothetical protein